MPEHRSRVTVINDSSDFVDVVREALQDRNCDVTGFAAVNVSLEDVVESRPGLLIIDLILSMPEQVMSGWELMLLARSHDKLRHVPIILCSADTKALRDRKDELASLADVHALEKPFSLRELEELVDRLVSGNTLRGELQTRGKDAGI